jgi:glycolate oxidase
MTRVDPALIAVLRAELLALLPTGCVKDDEGSRETYGHDESDMGDFQPDLVVFATCAADVQAVFRLCQKHGVPVTPVAARSGKSGGSLPLHGGVSLSLERMNRIVAISPEDLTIDVEPGVITGEVMKAVEAVGLFYPPDPNSWEFCSIGGNVAENAGGPRALKYGVTRDYVLGMDWVLPNGELLRVGKRTIKGVAGYDLTALFVGSEGTLGVATQVTLQLIPKPKKVLTALVVFRDVISAARAVSAVLAKGVLPRTLELLDDVSVKAVDGRGFNFPQATGAALIVEVDGNVEEGLWVELNEVSDVCAAHGALETLIAQDESQREKLWAARRMVSTCLRQLKPFKISEDIVVPRSRIPQAIEAFKAMGKELSLTVATYGHAGDGNLHANILFDGPAERPRVDEALARMMRLTLDLGGTITGEHGVGYAKRDFLALEQSPGVIAVQRSLKALFDPAGVLNPGKMFP